MMQTIKSSIELHTWLAHPTDPDVLFVGTFSGGLRVSRNATATSPTFVRAEGIQASRVVDVDVSPDGNTVIAISGSSNGNGTVWRSTDGGLNFVRDTVLEWYSKNRVCYCTFRW